MDLKTVTKLPIVGTVPATGQGDCDDAFRTIRTNLLHQLREGQKTVLVTSADEGDGKTFCAVRLAKAFAQMGEKTVVCDLNFRHPSLAKEFGVKETGLADLLKGAFKENEQIQAVISNTSTQNLDLLPAGQAVNVHPADLIAYRDLLKVLACLRESYDIVILDSPAIGKYGDVLIDDLADATSFVCRSGKTSKTAIEEVEKLNTENRLASSCIILNR